MSFNIEKMRKSKNMTQSEVANLLNMSKSNYGHIERGYISLTFEMAIELTKIFDCSLNDLAGIKEDIVISREDFDKIKTLSAEHNEIINKYDK